jgi:hypothetical protein
LARQVVDFTFDKNPENGNFNKLLKQELLGQRSLGFLPVTLAEVIQQRFASQNSSRLSMPWSVMGATNPANAEDGTIRKIHAESIERNAVHGSDAEDTARFELSFFFAGYELAK